MAISVASYSDDPGVFAAYGANAVTGPLGRFAALLPPNAIVLDAGVALGELARVAKVGAPLGISVKTGGITGWADDLPLGRRWFYNWAPDDLTGLVENIGLSVEAVSDDGLWIEVVARR